MTVDEIKDILRKRATIFTTGGKKHTNELLESWIGRINFKLENEDIPKDNLGETMTPLVMIFLKGLPYIPKELEDIELLSIFMSKNVGVSDDDFSDNFVIKKYYTLDNLIPCKWESEQIKPFPLFPELKEDDFPVWDGGDEMPSDILDEIVRLENEEEIEYHDDICEENYSEHKVGGHPSFIQPASDVEDGYKFVLQIVSDDKAKLNIVDGGNFYFFYNIKKDDWQVQCDFY